jgi:DNA repair exonuclease SbcCD ATPase subunit
MSEITPKEERDLLVQAGVMNEAIKNLEGALTKGFEQLKKEIQDLSRSLSNEKEEMNKTKSDIEKLRYDYEQLKKDFETEVAEKKAAIAARKQFFSTNWKDLLKPTGWILLLGCSTFGIGEYMHQKPSPTQEKIIESMQTQLQEFKETNNKQQDMIDKLLGKNVNFKAGLTNQND